jgi:hypothetical protein
MEYRIKSTKYVDEYGKPHQTKYYIEYKKPFLFFWERWVTIKHEICDMSDCYMTVTYFDSLEQAERFAVRHLCGDAVYDGHEIEIVKQGKC